MIHTGIDSTSTLSLNRSESDAGVCTSTGTPSRVLQCSLNSDQANQRRLSGNGINQDIQITLVRVVAMNNRSEDARIAGATLLDDSANVRAMQFEGFRRFHDF